MRVLLFVFVLVFLAGCSSLSRDSGFEVRTVQAEGRQEPWQNRSINRAVFTPEGVAAVYIALPQPVPTKWAEEFVDPDRTYEVGEGKRKTRVPLVRKVFRAVVALGFGETETYDAVVDRHMQGFTAFVPLAAADRVRGKPLIILSSGGKWGMTTRGKIVELDRGFALEELPAGFFAEHPSSVTQVIRLNPAENEHARQALEGLADMFPVRFFFRDDRDGGEYVGTPDIATVLAQFTSVEGVTDRLVSCTSLKLGPATVSAPAFAAAAYGIQAAVALAKEDCVKPLALPSLSLTGERPASGDRQSTQ